MTTKRDATSIAVVICCYTEDRYDDIRRAVGSIRRQTLPASGIVVVVDHNDALLRHAQEAFPDARVVPNRYHRGLSGARNTGIAASASDVIAFLDDDAEADPEWLRRLTNEYADPTVAGVGGLIEPDWDEGAPPWFPPEFGWVVGCSYTGQPRQRATVRNVIGANMSFRRDVVSGGFRESLGRIGTAPSGCEETELSIRIATSTGKRIVYQPAALVRHRIRPARATWGYFVSRCYAEGVSKATVSALAGSASALATERSYVAHVLLRAVCSGLLRSIIHWDKHAAARVVAVTLGLTSATAGYFTGQCRFAERRRQSARASLDILHAGEQGNTAVTAAESGGNLRAARNRLRAGSDDVLELMAEAGRRHGSTLKRSALSEGCRTRDRSPSRPSATREATRVRPMMIEMLLSNTVAAGRRWLERVGS